MAITRLKASSIKTGVKFVSFDGGLPNRPTIGTATDGGTGTTAAVAFTANNTAGLTYTALSSPDSLTASSTLSPITVTGLTTGTAYTFTVKATNSAGDSPASAASNSVTPVSPNSYESIQTVTLSSSSATVSFTSIPATFKHLQLRVLARGAGTGTVAMKLQFNSDTTSANYFSYHEIYGTGSATAASANASSGGIQLELFPTSSATASVFGAMIFDLLDYTSTNKNKTTRSLVGFDNNGSGFVFFMSGMYMPSTISAVTSIQITTMDASNLAQHSSFALYGIKG